MRVRCRKNWTIHKTFNSTAILSQKMKTNKRNIVQEIEQVIDSVSNTQRLSRHQSVQLSEKDDREDDDREASDNMRSRT